MVALVERKNLQRPAKSFAQGPPVIEGAEQAMQDDEWLALSVALIVQLHRKGAWRLDL